MGAGLGAGPRRGVTLHCGGGTALRGWTWGGRASEAGGRAATREYLGQHRPSHAPPRHPYNYPPRPRAFTTPPRGGGGAEGWGGRGQQRRADLGCTLRARPAGRDQAAATGVPMVNSEKPKRPALNPVLRCSGGGPSPAKGPPRPRPRPATSPRVGRAEERPARRRVHVYAVSAAPAARAACCGLRAACSSSQAARPAPRSRGVGGARVVCSPCVQRCRRVPVPLDVAVAGAPPVSTSPTAASRVAQRRRRLCRSPFWHASWGTLTPPPRPAVVSRLFAAIWR